MMGTTYAFGPFRLDVEAGILFRETKPLAIGRRAVAVMRILIEHADAPVSKEILIEAAWPGLSVEESNLTVQIAALRRALDEERWIETLPRRGYRYVGPSVTRAASGSQSARPANVSSESSAFGAAAETSRLSIVVLPFVNRSSDPEQEFLADILTGELTTYLSRIPESFVIASTTAFTYKGRACDLKQIGRDLGVRYAFEGSAQASGEILRVNARLVDVQSGTYLWAEQFDIEQNDRLQLQDEIVTRIARALQIRLSAIEIAQQRTVPPGDTAVEYLALKAEALFIAFGTWGRAESRESLRLCEQVLAIDPNNLRALAIAGLAIGVPVVIAESTDRAADLRRANELISRALAIEPNHYVARHGNAIILQAQRRFAEAIAEDERVLTLNPSYIGTYVALGLAYLATGQASQALSSAEKAMRLSPYDPLQFGLCHNKAAALFMLGKEDEAIDWARRSVTLLPDTGNAAHTILIAGLALAGRVEEASEALANYLARPATTIKTLAQWRRGRESDNPAYSLYCERLCEGLRKAGMPDR